MRPMQGNKRKTGLEQYYTPQEVADSVVKKLIPSIEGYKNKTWLEPAGGNGVFIETLLGNGCSKIFSVDVVPKHHMVEQAGFLQADFDFSNAIAIGNPPFGRNNSLSIPFFNHSARFSETICFIVPKSWRKWSVVNRLDSNFHLVDDYEINVAYVDGGGNRLSQQNCLNTIVQTWQRKQYMRKKVQVQDMKVLEKTSPKDADVALTVFGYNCGRVETDFDRVSNSTKIFLKLMNKRSLEALQSVDYSVFSKNTSYIDALSMQEINYLVNEFIFGQTSLPEKKCKECLCC